jgi:putative transposase
MPRQARLDIPGTLHHVMVRGIERKRIVSDDRDRSECMRRISHIATETETPIYAWALMTNHLHILLKSGPQGLPHFMRRWLTGYAMFYNRRHQRHGHLFQNRYRSIICEEDSYFTQLVRYIHLNPLKAKLVVNSEDLVRYPWCSHGIIMGYRQADWMDSEHVLKWFGDQRTSAHIAYQKYIDEGAGRDLPDFSGGGLVRSHGGWSEVIAKRQQGTARIADERILGCGNFVERLIEDAESLMKHQLKQRNLIVDLNHYVNTSCRNKRISVHEMQSGSRRRPVVELRETMAQHLVIECGISLSEAARHLGISTSAIAKALKRTGKA